MGLLEREHYLDQLAEFLRAATTDQGRTVLISGEAGIGKTALVEQFGTSLAAKQNSYGVPGSSLYPAPAGTIVRYCGADAGQSGHTHES